MTRSANKYGYPGLCALLLAGTACCQMPVVPADDTALAIQQTPAILETAGGAGVFVMPLDQQIAKAVADLATRLDVATEVISVKDAHTVNWRSGATGCPQQGMMYTQAIVPGVLLRLEAGGRVYRYHGRRGAQAVFCPDDRAEEPAYDPGEASL